MKVIFLDFDGVLNHQCWWWRNPLSETDNKAVREDQDIDPECVARLNALIAATGAKVVVSSTWRLCRTSEMLQVILNRNGFTGDVIDKTPCAWDMSEGGLLGKERGYEIRVWLDHHPEVTDFVVLDDDCDMPTVHHRHVKTSPFYGGFNDKCLAKALGLMGVAPPRVCVYCGHLFDGTICGCWPHRPTTGKAP